MNKKNMINKLKVFLRECNRTEKENSILFEKVLTEDITIKFEISKKLLSEVK